MNARESEKPMSDEMSTDSTTPETIKLNPASNDDALRLAAAIRSVCDIDGRWDAAEILQALATPPLPEEPSLWSVAKVGQRLFVRGQSSDSVGRWFEVSPGSGMYAVPWPEVCALGTPEVLEPETVKALREQVGFLANQRDRFRKAHDEMIKKYHAVCAERDEARAIVDQIRAEFRKAFTVDFGGWDWRDDDAIQTLARSLSRLLSDKPAGGDDEPPALEAS